MLNKSLKISILAGSLLVLSGCTPPKYISHSDCHQVEGSDGKTLCKATIGGIEGATFDYFRPNVNPIRLDETIGSIGNSCIKNDGYTEFYYFQKNTYYCREVTLEPSTAGYLAVSSTSNSACYFGCFDEFYKSDIFKPNDLYSSSPLLPEGSEVQQKMTINLLASTAVDIRTPFAPLGSSNIPVGAKISAEVLSKTPDTFGDVYDYSLLHSDSTMQLSGKRTDGSLYKKELAVNVVKRVLTVISPDGSTEEITDANLSFSTEGKALGEYVLKLELDIELLDYQASDRSVGLKYTWKKQAATKITLVKVASPTGATGGSNE
ncbi:MAG: hypothetical protein RPR97_10000 [Colwellia sp.]|jgi:hypothetical protein